MSLHENPVNGSVAVTRSQVTGHRPGRSPQRTHFVSFVNGAQKMLQYALSTLASVTQSEHAFRHQLAAVSFTFRAALPLVCTGTQPHSESCAPYSHRTPTVKRLSSQLVRDASEFASWSDIKVDSSQVVPQFN